MPHVCRLRFGISEKKQNIHRYFNDTVRKTWKEDPERLWRKKELKPFTDYIELSRFALSEDDLRVMSFYCYFIAMISVFSISL